MMTTSPVLIVGGGPVGLSLALGLARHGVRSTLVERNETTSRTSRAPAIHVRTLETLRPWGVAERLLEEGDLLSSLTIHEASPDSRPLVSLDLEEFADDVDSPGLLLLEQGRTEELLLEAVRESGLCEVRFGTEAVGLEADPDGVNVVTAPAEKDEPPSRTRARFVVGCDGARSFVRDALGLSFEGITYGLSPMLADVRVDRALDALPFPRFQDDDDGLTFGIRLDPGVWRLIRLDVDPPPAGQGEADEVGEGEVARRARQVLGTEDVDTLWASRFRIHRRSAPSFRVGRVVLAGDAAHVHSPVGGMGMNAGIQDAGNLAWKLRNALNGGNVDRLLDSYETERRAMVVGSVSRYTDLVTRWFLQRSKRARRAAFAGLALALNVPAARKRAARRTMMIDLDCPASDLVDPSDRAAGVRLPNPKLQGPLGRRARLHDLVGTGPALIEVTGRGGIAMQGPPAIRRLRIGPDDWRDPDDGIRRLLGGRDGRILVRPDGHVAWARRSAFGVKDAIRRALGFDPVRR